MSCWSILALAGYLSLAVGRWGSGAALPVPHRDTPPPRRIPVVAVGSIQDAQTVDLPGRIPDALGADLRLALVRYLMHTTENRYDVITSGDDAYDWQVAGDVAVTRAGETSSYLLTLRLYRHLGATNTLVGQWSGVADTLLYLTCNVPAADGVHPYGAVGAIGDEIRMLIHSGEALDQAQTISRLARRAPIAGVDTMLTAATPLTTDDAGRQEVVSGTPFRVGIPTDCAGPAYVLYTDAGGWPHAVPVAAAGKDDAHRQSAELTAGIVTVPRMRTLLVCMRRQAVAHNAAPAASAAPTVPAAARTATANDPTLPVHILAGLAHGFPGNNPVEADPIVAAFLAQHAADDPKEWRIEKVEYWVIPVAKDR